jgi:hypothetical protein
MRLFYLLSIIVFFTFCKKKDKASETASPTNSTTGSTVIDGDHGTFLSVYNTSKFGNLVFGDSIVQASFYDAPGMNQNIINAGTVSLNSVTLQPYANNVYSSTNQINLKNMSWQISGSGTITATNFSYTPIHPTYSGDGALPDTVTASGFTFNVTGITNINEPVYIAISQGSAPITKTVTSVPSTVSLSSSELAGFVINQDFTIRLSLFNYSHITLNSHQYGINANRTYQKSCFLKQ